MTVGRIGRVMTMHDPSLGAMAAISCVFLEGSLFGVVLKGHHKEANHFGVPILEDTRIWVLGGC